MSVIKLHSFSEKIPCPAATALWDHSGHSLRGVAAAKEHHFIFSMIASAYSEVPTALGSSRDGFMS